MPDGATVGHGSIPEGSEDRGVGSRCDMEVVKDFARSKGLEVKQHLTERQWDMMAELMAVKTEGWAVDVVQRWIQDSRKLRRQSTKFLPKDARVKSFYGSRSRKECTLTPPVALSGANKRARESSSSTLVVVKNSLISIPAPVRASESRGSSVMQERCQKLHLHCVTPCRAASNFTCQHTSSRNSHSSLARSNTSQHSWSILKSTDKVSSQHCECGSLCAEHKNCKDFAEYSRPHSISGLHSSQRNAKEAAHSIGHCSCDPYTSENSTGVSSLPSSTGTKDRSRSWSSSVSSRNMFTTSRTLHTSPVLPSTEGHGGGLQDVCFRQRGNHRVNQAGGKGKGPGQSATDIAMDRNGAVSDCDDELLLLLHQYGHPGQ